MSHIVSGGDKLELDRVNGKRYYDGNGCNLAYSLRWVGHPGYYEAEWPGLAHWPQTGAGALQR